MAASAARVLRSVKPHVPLIKFPMRGCPGPSQTSAAASSPSTQTASVSKPPSDSKPIGSTPRGSGIDWADLPPRYRRRNIPQDEMESIEKGGTV